MIHSHQTSLEIVGCVSKSVTKAADQLFGDRSLHPLLVCLGGVYALEHFKISSRCLYGQAQWIEILENEKPIWAGSSPQRPHFWLQSQFGETIDFNISVSHRLNSPSGPKEKSKYSPPMLWSLEIPQFYEYHVEGIAEINPEDHKLLKQLDRLKRRIEIAISEYEKSKLIEFPNEPLLGPERKLLDSTQKEFQHFDRALSIHGFPEKLSLSISTTCDDHSQFSPPP